MPVERLKSHPLVESNVGRVALMRGPVVYCLESIDNDEPMATLIFPRDSELTAEYRPQLLGGVAVVKGVAIAYSPKAWPGPLYVPFERVPAPKVTTFTAIPYYANANRGPVDMLVWVPETAEQARPKSRTD
jgi:DUF1680 family protein